MAGAAGPPRAWLRQRWCRRLRWHLAPVRPRRSPAVTT